MNLVKSVRSTNASSRAERWSMPLVDRWTPSSLSLATGDVVVYGSHGIGRIESAPLAEGALSDRVVIAFESGLRVTLPLARARNVLRSLSGESELNEVRRTLRANLAPSVEPWSRRYRFAREKLAEGRVGGLAEIVRDSLGRECRRSSASSAPSAGRSEAEVCRRARKLLAAEIAACRGIGPEAADAWVVEQVSGAHAYAHRRSVIAENVPRV